MKTLRKINRSAVMLTASLAALGAMVTPGVAAIDTNLLNGLVAYYPLETTNGPGGTTTPDLINAYDMQLQGLTSADLQQGYTNYSASASSNHFYGPNNKTFKFHSSNGGSLLKYVANPGEYLPPNLLPAYTISMWVCVGSGGFPNQYGDPTTGNDTRFYGENYFPNNSDSLWVIGSQSSSTAAHWLIRSKSEKGQPAYSYAQTPDYNAVGEPNANTWGPPSCCIQGQTSTAITDTNTGSTITNGVMDGHWHHFVVKQTANGSISTYIDGKYDFGSFMHSSNRVSVVNNGDGTFTTNYLASALPDKPLLNQNGEAYRYTVNTVTLGGIGRATSPQTPTDGRLDDFAVWNRALSDTEIMEVYSNGIPADLLPALTNLPPVLNSFNADFREAISGDTVPVRWNIAHAENADSITIDNGIGDVKSLTSTSSGNGSIAVPVSATTTYTISLGYTNHPGSSHGAFTNTLSLTVTPVTNATFTSNWHLLSRFDNIGTTTAGISGPGNNANFGWSSPSADFSGLADQFNVRNVTGASTNFVATEGGTATNRPALSLLALNGYGLTVGKSNTYFFRFYVANTNCTPFIFAAGLTAKNFRALGDLIGNQAGLTLQLVRNGGGQPIDLQLFNGPSASAGTYSYVSDGVNGDANGIKQATVYNVWMDITNGGVTLTTNSTDGGQTFTTNQSSQTFYSVWLSTNGGTRVQLVNNYAADTDYINYDATVGVVSKDYNQFIISHDNQFIGSPSGKDVVLFDDIYVSKNGYNSSLPVAQSAFLPAQPILISILGGTNLIYDHSYPSIQLSWTDNGCGPYSVQKSTKLNPADWVTISSGIPNQGVTNSYQDYSLNPADTNVFYRITTP